MVNVPIGAGTIRIALWQYQAWHVAYPVVAIANND